MRLAYLDEAGISPQEPFLVMAGIIVHADSQLAFLETALAKLADRWIPIEHRDGFVFHAVELFNGGGKVFDRHSSRFTRGDRLLIVNELIQLIADFNLPISFGFVDKSDYPSDPELREIWPTLSIRQRIVQMHAAAFLACSFSIEMYMRENADDEICMIIVENNDQAGLLIKEAQLASQKPRADDVQPEEWKYLFPFRKIKEDPLFQEKRSSGLMQMADLLAYVIKRVLMSKSEYYPLIGKLLPQIIIHPAPIEPPQTATRSQP